MSLTYEDNDSPPVALISSDDEDRFVYISEELPNEDEQPIGPQVMDKVWDTATINSIADALNSGITLRQLIDLFSQTQLNETAGEVKEGRTDEIDIEPYESIQTVPAPQNERIIVGGPAGSGKSFFAAAYARLWKKLHPDGIIHIFCRQADDPAFADIDHEEIVVDQSIIGEELGIHDFVDTLVIFDDMDNLQDKKTIEYIHKLLNDLMACGRKQNIYVIYVTHIFMNRSKTQVPLNEANKIVFFNGMGDRQNVNVLKNYAQMNKHEIERLTSIPSRWCCLERKRPRYVVHEKGIFLL
jgi:hypothetical protein